MNIIEWINIPTFIETKLDRKILYKKHKIKVLIWRNHKQIEEYKTNSVIKARKWIKQNAWDYIYDCGECMIYIEINNIRIKYYKFMEKKYILDED